MPLIPITDSTDPRLDDYTHLTDIVLRSKHEPEKGLFIAESSTVIRRALAAGPPAAVVPHGREVAVDLDGRRRRASGRDVPVFVGEPKLLEEITGFHLHRGALAAMHRPVEPSVRELLAGARGGAGARRVAILEDVVDHTNVGAAFRSAAALGVDAVLVTPRCSDPLYRRSVRVCMGTVFQVPWTRIPWPSADRRAAGGRVHGRGARAVRRLGHARRARRAKPTRRRRSSRHRGRRPGRGAWRRPTRWCGSRWPGEWTR